MNSESRGGKATKTKITKNDNESYLNHKQTISDQNHQQQQQQQETLDIDANPKKSNNNNNYNAASMLATVDETKLAETEENALLCKNSPIYLNSTLKGGFKAGNYTDFGRVADMNQCIKLCCGNSKCHVALMLEQNCFFVECHDEDGCLPVKAKTTHALAALNPKVSFITSRSEEGKRKIFYACENILFLYAVESL